MANKFHEQFVYVAMDLGIDPKLYDEIKQRQEQEALGAFIAEVGLMAVPRAEVMEDRNLTVPVSKALEMIGLLREKEAQLAQECERSRGIGLAYADAEDELGRRGALLGKMLPLIKTLLGETQSRATHAACQEVIVAYEELIHGRDPADPNAKAEDPRSVGHENSGHAADCAGYAAAGVGGLQRPGEEAGVRIVRDSRRLPVFPVFV